MTPSLPFCSCPPMHSCARHGVHKSYVAKGAKPAAPRKTYKRPKQVSEDRKKLLKRWAFIKSCMVLAQKRTDGFVSCMECGRKDPPLIDLDHIIPTGNGGKWTPDNAQLLCRDCHNAKHRNLPEWTEAS